MARELPKFAPTTMEQYEELIDIALEISQERYDTEVAIARANAVDQWDAEEPARREAMMKQAAANIHAMMEETDDGPKPLSEAKVSELMTKAAEEMNAQLAKEKQEHIDQAASMVQQPQSRKDFEATYGFYKDEILQAQQREEEEKERANQPTGFSYDAYYQLGNRQIYSVADARFINTRSLPTDAKIIKVNDTPEQFRYGVLEFYKNNGFPDVKISFELLTLEECKESQIAEVDAQIHENIIAGFSYPLNFGRSTETLYFSLSETDQLNFSNMANVANLLIQGNVEQDISWPAWRKAAHKSYDSPITISFSPQKFLDVYLQGAVKHINDCLDKGRQIKENIRKAKTKAEVANCILAPTEIAKLREG